MYTIILAILLDIGIIFAAGIWLTWIGIMPVRIGPQKIDVPRDSGLGWFRFFARVLGPIIIVATGWQMVRDVRRMIQPLPVIWQDFKSDKGRFQVDLPGEPTPTSFEISMLDHTATEYEFKAAIPDRDANFAVSYVDCPEAVLGFEPHAFLDTGLESQVAAKNLQVLKKTPTTVDDCPALYFSMDSRKQGLQIEGFLVLDGYRLYQLGAQYKGDRTEADRKRFLSSFRVLHTSH
jgi:hypothetical protein